MTGDIRHTALYFLSSLRWRSRCVLNGQKIDGSHGGSTRCLAAMAPTFLQEQTADCSGLLTPGNIGYP